jgi:hypothetical protein
MEESNALTKKVKEDLQEEIRQLEAEIASTTNLLKRNEIDYMIAPQSGTIPENLMSTFKTSKEPKFQTNSTLKESSQTDPNLLNYPDLGLHRTTSEVVKNTQNLIKSFQESGHYNSLHTKNHTNKKRKNSNITPKRKFSNYPPLGPTKKKKTVNQFKLSPLKETVDQKVKARILNMIETEKKLNKIGTEFLEDEEEEKKKNTKDKKGKESSEESWRVMVQRKADESLGKLQDSLFQKQGIEMSRTEKIYSTGGTSLPGQNRFKGDVAQIDLIRVKKKRVKKEKSGTETVQLELSFEMS